MGTNAIPGRTDSGVSVAANCATGYRKVARTSGGAASVQVECSSGSWIAPRDTTAAKCEAKTNDPFLASSTWKCTKKDEKQKTCEFVKGKNEENAKCFKAKKEGGQKNLVQPAMGRIARNALLHTWD